MPHYLERPPANIKHLTLALLFIFTVGPRFCFTQSIPCDDILLSETDVLPNGFTVSSRTNILISDDGGKTGFAIFGLLIDSTFACTIRTVGAGACVNSGDPIHIVFRDSSRLELSNMGPFNCEAKSSLYFSSKFKNFSVLQMLSEKTIAKLTVWTKQKSLSRNVNVEVAEQVRGLLQCFDQTRGHNTFEKLMTDRIFTMVESQPEYTGGYDAMLEFIKKNMRYPPAARRLGLSGMVYTEFIVQKDGSITDIKTLQGVHPELDKEAHRVIKLMPPWKPGLHNGKPAIVRFVLPISFKISDGGNRP